MNRQRAEVATNSGSNLFAAGKLDDAIAQYKEALAFDADYADAHRGLAQALQQKGDAAGAAAERQRAEALAAIQ